MINQGNKLKYKVKKSLMMKTLNKLRINPDKILKDEELKSLNGGDCWVCTVYCNGAPNTFGAGCGESLDWVNYTCNHLWNQGGCTCSCM